MKILKATCCGLALSLTACTVEMQMENELSLAIELGDLSGNCTGSEVFESDNGSARIHRELGLNSARQEICRFSIDYTYRITELANVNEDIESELRAKNLNPDRVDTRIERASFVFDNIELTDVYGTRVTPPTVPFFGLTMAFGNDQFVKKTATNITLDEGGLELSNLNSLNTEGVRLLNQAIEAGAPILIDGTVDLDLAETDRVRLGQELTNGHISVDLTALLTAEASLSLF